MDLSDDLALHVVVELPLGTGHQLLPPVGLDQLQLLLRDEVVPAGAGQQHPRLVAVKSHQTIHLETVLRILD